jgi:hypothetical protein
MRFLLVAFVLGQGIWISGCTTMDVSQCRSVEWFKVGLIDGRRGLPADYLQQHQKACEASGREVAAQEYEAGRQQGLLEYCTPGEAYRAGSEGKSYRGVCSQEVEKEFLTQFAAGRQTWQLKQERAELREEQKRRREEIEKDHSLVGDVAKAYHLFSGTSATEDIDQRENQLSDQIHERDSKAPVSRLSLQPQVNMSGMESAAGAMFGTVMGFGLGHAIQGHWRDDGVKWTAIDASMISAIAVIGHNCPGNVKTETSGSVTAIASSDCQVLAPLWFLGFLGSRIWQSVELWSHTRRAFSPYEEKKPSVFLPEYVSTVPVSDTMGVGAGWSFN